MMMKSLFVSFLSLVLQLRLLAFSVIVPIVLVDAQPQRGGGPPLQPLGDVLMLFLDSNKDSKVSMEEINSQLQTLEQMFSAGDEEGTEYLQILKGIQAVVPQLFDLLDANQNGSLSKSEMKLLTKFEKAIQKGGRFKPFVRDCFVLLDENKDDSLTLEEWQGARKFLPEMATMFHEIFPELRDTPKELEKFVEQILTGNDDAAVGVSKQAFDYLDANNDGTVERQEVGSTYNSVGKRFLEISKTIKQMGPMLAMFGGGGGGFGGPGMRTEF